MPYSVSSPGRKTLFQNFCIILLALRGWRAEVAAPLPKQCVIIGAPHTTWFDLILTLLLMGATGVRFRWISKAELFRPPLGWLLRALGGMPVLRGARANFVAQIVEKFAQYPDLRIAIVPEGTRRYIDHWKTGFYYIATGAGVPVVLGYADYAKRRVGLGPIYMPAGDIDADFERYRAFYAQITGAIPARQGEIRRTSE
ncbi:1-acyl-sn-glycerol-3-phosphate acyltransferase [Candidatus Chloroploca sp. Khr17]|uniref:1-acyl-sn-glycerol-3-phosphate acyltransferase n=1 Tax=Candidatus Chloroploca sp. Khr17 TaxID=2496869 RepID=UPI00101D1522|nr:1-acyl-sn-glycerol-3-phosphate acyltransferase [Candidatus Chloroploca sp. Khr17]